MSDTDEHHVPDGSAGVEQNLFQNAIRAELGEMNDIESMCPKCEENGRTRLMITKIPHFREIIISSFNCDHCGESNREVQFGGEYGPKKVKYHLEVKNSRDMNRQVVKSDYATLSIPELELELGPDAQKGTLNTVEGVLQQVKDGLEFQQALRKIQHPELHDQIAAFIEKLETYRSGDKPFNVWLEDPAGNSYIEAVVGDGHVDRQLTKFEITRSDAERRQIGLAGDDMYNPTRPEEDEAAVEAGVTAAVTEFQQPCPGCVVIGTVKVHQTHIPFFGSIVIMAFRCDACGYKSNEVKNAGQIPERGKRATLKVLNESDLSRDVLKSDTTQLRIPEIDLEMAPGTLGGFFTTVEGVMQQVYENLSKMRQLDFEGGDSEDTSTHVDGVPKTTMKAFVQRVADLRDGKVFPFTLILEDPVGMVYIQNPRSHLPPPKNEDPQLEIIEYDLTEEEKEDLGL